MRKQAGMKGIPLLFMTILLTLLLSGCAAQKKQEDIIILYTGDVHCAVDEDIGYAGLSACKEWMEEKTPYVTLADCGDALQGDAIGTISQGEYLVDIMNQAEYDLAVLGNHEFDYGMKQLTRLMDQADAQYLGCNISYTGQGDNALAELKPYEIIAYGDVEVAFVGISTPESITKSTPAYFMDEAGNFVYDFCGGDGGAALYAKVQETVEECRDKGADYVVALAHLGDDEASAPFCSTDLIGATSGIDVVLDGHSHSVISSEVIKNKEGKKVLLSSTGTQLNNIGQLVITAQGNLSTGLISDYSDIDKEMDTYIKDIQNEFENDLNNVVAHSDVKLTTASDTGIRLIRSRETNLGDFTADAYRAIAEADIALVNGGGIRADLPEGDITYGDMIAVHPYGNTLCVAKATGQEILDALEMGSRDTLPETDDGENAVGECGGFLQVSGLRYTINASVESTVELDENGMFVSCGDIRRVADAEVLTADGSYVPIDPEQVYTVASHNYLIKEGGDGMNMFMDNELTLNEGMLDYQILITYITENLGGSVDSSYGAPQDRITVSWE